MNLEKFIHERETEGMSNLNPIKKDMTIDYIIKINSLYSHLRTYCKQLDFCVDISKEKSPSIFIFNSSESILVLEESIAFHCFFISIALYI